MKPPKAVKANFGPCMNVDIEVDSGLSLHMHELHSHSLKLTFSRAVLCSLSIFGLGIGGSD